MEDFLLDENYNPIIEDGDFVTRESSQQHVELLLKTNKGDWKENPQTGFGIDHYMKSSTAKLQEFERNLKVELEADGFKNPEVNFGEDLTNLEINIAD